LQFANSSVTSFATVQCGGSYLGIDNVTSPTTLIDPCIFQQNANAIFAGPNPYIDITAPPYNARGVTINTTGSGSGNSLTVSVNTFKNGDGITIAAGGAAPTMTTPGAPTVQPGEAESETTPDAFMTSTTLGSSCYNYRTFAEDILGGVTAASPVTTNCNGPATLGQVTLALSAASQTGKVFSFTTSTAHGLAQYALAHVTAGANSYYLSQWDIIQTITNSTQAGATQTVMNSGTATPTAASGTLVYFTGNNVTLPAVSGSYRSWVCVERPGDASYHIIGTPLPTTTRFVDFGATLSANPVVPWYISNANCTAGSAQPQLDDDIVQAGGGTTGITLKFGMTTSVSGTAVRLDNHNAIGEAQIAAVASPSAVAGIYIPVGTFPINSAVGIGGTGIIQAGNLVVNAPVVPVSGTRWSGETYKGTTSGNLPPFANDSPPLITCNSNPCIDMHFFNGYPFYMANLAIFGPSNGNGVLMVSASQFTSKFFNLQFETGNNANDNMGIALFEPPGTSMPFECDWCTFAGGPGQVVDQTWTPLVLLEGSSSNGASGIILKGGNFNRRGIFSKSTDGGGNQVYIDSTYRQGGIIPFVMFENNNGNSFPTLYMNHVHFDTEQQALVAMEGDAGQNMFLTYYIGVANNPQNDGGGDPSEVTGSGSQSIECDGGRLDDDGPNGLFMPCVGWVFDQQNLNATNPITVPGVTTPLLNGNVYYVLPTTAGADLGTKIQTVRAIANTASPLGAIIDITAFSGTQTVANSFWGGTLPSSASYVESIRTPCNLNVVTSVAMVMPTHYSMSNDCGWGLATPYPFGGFSLQAANSFPTSTPVLELGVTGTASFGVYLHGSYRVTCVDPAGTAIASCITVQNTWCQQGCGWDNLISDGGLVDIHGSQAQNSGPYRNSIIGLNGLASAGAKGMQVGDASALLIGKILFDHITCDGVADTTEPTTCMTIDAASITIHSFDGEHCVNCLVVGSARNTHGVKIEAYGCAGTAGYPVTDCVQWSNAFAVDGSVMEAGYTLAGTNVTNLFHDEQTPACTIPTATAAELALYARDGANITSTQPNLCPSTTAGTTVAALPSASTYKGTSIYVTDSTAISAEGQTCVGGGTTAASAFAAGGSWKCF
jgi:hypothetical protein